MSWNYRVMRKRSSDTTWLEIVEVYYAKDNVTPMAYGAASAPFTEIVEEDQEDPFVYLSWTIDKMREALAKPILNEDDFGVDGKSRIDPAS